MDSEHRSTKDQNVIEYLETKIKAYEKKALQARKKVNKLNLVSSRIDKQQKTVEKLLSQYDRDELDRKKQIKDSDAVLNAFRKSIATKNVQMEEKYKALEDLESNIKLRASEVDFKIRKIQDALLEWHAASQIVSDNCQTSVLYAADKFYNWQQVVPSISCWLANEARVRSTIYATASMMGMSEEVIAQRELKQQLQDFSDQYYKDVSQQSRLPPLKQINEQRQHRSEVFDQLHLKLVKQLRGYVRSCDSLEQEIVQKEQLRMKLTSIAMEICNVLNDETRIGLGHCETEARRKIEFILQNFQQASEGKEHQSLPEELLMELRNTAKTQLEYDVLELTKARKILAGLLPQSLEQPSMVSSLSGSDESYLSPGKTAKESSVNHVSFVVDHHHNAILPQVKKPFKEIKDNITKNKANEVLKAKLIQLKTIADNYNPKLNIIFNKLRSARDEDAFDPENPVQEPDESSEIVNTIYSLNAVKHLQLTTAETITESIVLLQRLLDNAKREEESVLELHQQEASNRPVSSSFTLRMEQQQSIGYQELQKKVTKEFQRTQIILEDWMFDKVNKQFEFAREKLASELLSAGKISAEDAEQLLAKYKTNLKLETNDPATLASKLPFPILSPEFPMVVAPNDETEDNVRDMLSLSEKLLLDLEKQLQTENTRNQEAFSMQQVKETQRVQNTNGNHHNNDEGKEASVVATGNSEEGDILLATAEIIMHNDLYHISLVWRQRENMATFVARNLLPKRKYKEYIMNISVEVLGEITGMNVDNVVNHMLYNTQKAFQQITHHIQVEEIRPAYYEELKEIFDNGLHQDLDILMYLPHYLPFGSEIYHHNTSNQMESTVEQARGLLLKVMTCRADHGGLLLHCFAQIRSMR